MGRTATAKRADAHTDTDESIKPGQLSAALKAGASKGESVRIAPPNMQTVQFRLIGTAPLVQNAFSQKAKNEMLAKHVAGSTAGSKKKREAKDVNALMEGAIHRSTEGWIGIPASAFRCAAISACRLVGFKMTLAKLSIFVPADGFDRNDGTPLIKLLAGDPERTEMATRNANGMPDIRVRPLWREWGLNLKVRFDADQFTVEDVTNLISRVGEQVGIGEGRADSRSSAGMGWGSFRIAGEHDVVPIDTARGKRGPRARAAAAAAPAPTKRAKKAAPAGQSWAEIAAAADRAAGQR